MSLRLKANRRFPSIPVVVADQANHTQVLMAMKEALDIGQRRTGDLLNSFIRVEDLIDLGIITIEGNTNSIVGADLSEIANIGDLSGAATGDFLRFDGDEWINDQLSASDITQAMVLQHEAALTIGWSQITGEPTIPASLDDLSDVTIVSPTVTDVLTYNGSQWVPAPPSGGGGGAVYLDDLLDVDAPYPQPGDALVFDGYGWVPVAMPAVGVSSVSIGTVTTYSGLTLDVTAEGTVDWFAWSTAAQALASTTITQGRKRSAAGPNGACGYWTNGAPSTGNLTSWGFSSVTFGAGDSVFSRTSGSISNGVFRSCVAGDALILVVPAATTTRVLRLYVSNANDYDIVATLTDGTTDSQLNITPGTANAYIPITFSAATPGQYLCVEMIKRGSNGNMAFSICTIGTV